MNAFEAWLEHLFARSPGDLESTPWYHRSDDPPTEWTRRYEESDTPVAQAERILRLFGLGHEYSAAKDKVPEIIHRWLERHLDAPVELRAYAVQASTGMVM